ncbi:HAD-IA family hydrolase [Paenibacillus sp. F411]|uniref:HAD-IA family hydrolase n=1 Tax=Paenibacillus sp. F411 TaxID=2820239 RepID=UPI001AAFEA93|nr:HAD-IA family hydrolase [Paenibacillus sp. F411]MBO2943367.1 HAD-IA family hydrolase [Paenibacillus sp. F411]
MKPYWIFDFDGTLVQSKDLAVQIFNELSQKHGGRLIKDEEIATLAAMSIPDRLKALKVPMYKLPALLVEGRIEYKKALLSLEPVAGIQHALHQLKAKGCKLGIISSNSVENIRLFIDHHGLQDFDFIHSASNLFGKHKAIIRLAKKHSLHVSDILYIGDELRDIEACHQINVAVVAAAWGWDSPELLESAAPDFICHSPLELSTLMSQRT